jgi:tRNA nucleotidyltransferase (CCA-adding enzyme)
MRTLNKHSKRRRAGKSVLAIKIRKLAKVYDNMMSRCYRDNTEYAEWYHNKGIRVCNEWKGKSSIFILWGLLNGYKPGLEIDRVDGSKDYSPSNCRWVTHQENMNNQSPEPRRDKKDNLPKNIYAVRHNRSTSYQVKFKRSGINHFVGEFNRVSDAVKAKTKALAMVNNQPAYIHLN